MQDDFVRISLCVVGIVAIVVVFSIGHQLPKDFTCAHYNYTSQQCDVYTRQEGK